MKFTTLSSIAFALGHVALVRACGDDHAHSHDLKKRLPPSTPLAPPTRPLVWGDINIIHTTDSHGWLLGHQHTSFPEPNYSGDFGDFASFVTHMKQIAKEKGVDLLLVDSGDLHDGTGLSDGGPPGSIDAHDSNQFIAKLPYDVMAIGNHELYIYNNTLDMHTNFAPQLKGRYLSSNVNLTVAGANGQNQSVPVGERFVKFKTEHGRKVTALGVLFDFTGNDEGTTVQTVANMVKESWFAEAIAEEPDFFLLAGHMPVSNDDWPLVFNAVRAVHATTPIIILGGHTHIRDCNQPDGRSMALESGRYMETVGWMSLTLGKNFKESSTNNLTFTRRYLDPNRVTYEYHAATSNRSFDTSLGQSITKGLLNLSSAFDLSFEFGVAPEDFTISRVPFDANNSLNELLVNQVFAVALSINNTRANNPRIFITNSGELRFDIYAGTFTKNDQITALPFADAFVFIPNVTLGAANQILPILNKEGEERKRFIEELDERAYARGDVEKRYRQWLEEMYSRSEEGLERRATENATLGYVTHDECPGVGDDILHTALPSFRIPDFLASNPPDISDDEPIDLVFIDFIEDQLLSILNSVQTAKNYTSSDVQSYSPFLASEVFGLFAERVWNTTGSS